MSEHALGALGYRFPPGTIESFSVKSNLETENSGAIAAGHHDSFGSGIVTSRFQSPIPLNAGWIFKDNLSDMTQDEQAEARKRYRIWEGSQRYQEFGVVQFKDCMKTILSNYLSNVAQP